MDDLVVVGEDEGVADASVRWTGNGSTVIGVPAFTRAEVPGGMTYVSSREVVDSGANAAQAAAARASTAPAVTPTVTSRRII